MNLQSIGCAVHVLALCPRYQIFKVKKQRNHEMFDEVSEFAVPAIVEHHEQVRHKVNKFKFNEYASIALARAVQNMGGVRKYSLKPILDSSAKWSSTIEMDERDWFLRRAYAEVARSHPQLVKFPFRDSDYIMSRNCAGILRPFQHASNILQKDGEPVSIVLPVFAALRKQLESTVQIEVCGPTMGTTEFLSEEQLDEHCQNLRKNLRSEVDRHLHHIMRFKSVLEIAASVDPRYKSLAFLPKEQIQSAQQLLCAAVIEHAKQNDIVSPADEVANHDRHDEMHNKYPRKRSFVGMDSFMGVMNKVSRCSNSEGSERIEDLEHEQMLLKKMCKAEVRAWFAKDQLAIQSDPIFWWRQNHEHWPYIAPVARKYLSIPSSNAGIERMFSSCRELLEHTRQSMGSTSVERSIKLFMNMEYLGMF